jgi:O-antigen/teichoic acid export membrane protein
MYNAGFAIINTYVGMIFTAMSTDYYPRLAGVSHSNIISREVINQQAEIAILLLAPIILVFLVFINWVVITLYSSKFTPINDMILYAALGMFFKAASWSMAFIFLAKSASKIFFWNELITNVYLLALNLLGYKYFGLLGMGISFLVAYFLYVLQVFFIIRYKYQFSFTPAFYKIFILHFALAIVCLVVVKILPSPFSYIVGSHFIIASSYFAYKELDRRLDIKAVISDIKNRF